LFCKTKSNYFAKQKLVFWERKTVILQKSKNACNFRKKVVFRDKTPKLFSKNRKQPKKIYLFPIILGKQELYSFFFPKYILISFQ